MLHFLFCAASLSWEQFDEGTVLVIVFATLNTFTDRKDILIENL